MPVSGEACGSHPASYLEVFLEEESAKRALGRLIPRIVPGVAFTLHAFQGKQDLLKKLPARLRALRKYTQDDWALVVLVDLDRDACAELKCRLERDVQMARFLTPSIAGGERPEALARIAVHELEAWLLGAPEAIAAAYPRIRPSYAQKAKYRNPDDIQHAADALANLLSRNGYFKEGVSKIATAEAIARHMDPDVNLSPSFGVFREGLRRLAGTAYKDRGR